MFELMYEAKGVGLAANQVDLPFRLFVANLDGVPDEGEEMVFINPVISRPKGLDEAEEGCLSLPSLYGQVRRPKQVRVEAYTLDGDTFNEEISGIFSRVLQHETDHLDGVLFTDRLSATGKLEVQPRLEEFEVEFNSRRHVGEFSSDEDIAARLAEFETRYC